MRYLLIIPLALILAGCGGLGWNREQTPDIEYVEVKVPISNVPAPPNTDCPPLEIDTLPAELREDAGEIAKAYRISIEQLRDCSALRERVIDKYREIASEDSQRIADETGNGPVAIAGPMGSGGPVVAPPGNGAPQPSSGGDLPSEELLRQMRIERQFEDLEGDFEDLTRKDYDIE